MECNIRKHDLRQVEIKVAYPLDRSRSSQRYRLELFFFIPPQLGITPGRYSQSQFYEDLHSYTRFKTPMLSFANLLDPDLPTNPLNRVERQLGAAARDTRSIVYELKVLAMVMMSQLREGTRHLRRLGPDRKSATAESNAEVANWLQSLAEALARIRRLENLLQTAAADAEVKTAWRRTDDCMSMHVISRLRAAVNRSQSDEQATWMQGARNIMRDELTYRVEAKYMRVRPGNRRLAEAYIHRASLLKKFAGQALYLSAASRILVSPARQLVAVMARAIGMAGAVAIAFLAGGMLREKTLGFAVALVLADIFKDRFKEVAGVFLTPILPAWAADQSGKLVDTSIGRVVGSTREAMRWIHADELPKAVSEERNATPLDLAVIGPGAAVARYVKTVRIFTRKIFAAHERAPAIDEIFRLHMGRFLLRMDEPDERVPTLNAAGEIVSVHGDRAYYVDLIIQLREIGGPDATVQHTRLVLTRRGILRVESA